MVYPVPVVTVCIVAAIWAVRGRKEPITSWSSPRMLDVQKQWQTLYDSFDSTWTKYNHGGRDKMLDDVLDKNLSGKESAPFGRDVQRAPASTEQAKHV